MAKQPLPESPPTRDMTIGNFEISDTTSSGAIGDRLSLAHDIDLTMGAVGDASSADTASKTLPDVAIAGDPVDVQTIEPYFLAIGDMNFTTAKENAEAGVEPDYIIGEDGVIRQNPNKEVIAKDGNLNIQVEGQDDAALKAENEAQKASIRELIRYYQKYNPGKPVPQEWIDKLYAQPGSVSKKDAAARNQTDTPRAAPENVSVPGNNSAPRRTSSRGSSPGYRGGGPSGSGRRGYDGVANNFRPTGNVEKHPPMPGDMKLEGPPTITPEKINEVLASYGSPASGLGQYIYDKGVEAGINPAVALAFYVQESGCGTAGIAARTKSFGNIRGSGPAGSDSGFRAYNTYEQGIDDWYRLIKDQYLAPVDQGGRGYTTLSQVLNTYAPKSENDTEAYIAQVKGNVKGWADDTGKDASTAFV